MGSGLPYGLAATLHAPDRPLVALVGDGAMQMNGINELSQTLPAFPYAAYADLLGPTGIRVDHPGEVDDAWDRALAADLPVVIEAIVDPDVPLLPPFPAGREKLDSCRRALDQEDDGAHARALLDEQERQEES